MSFQCSICLEDATKDIEITICKHVFHTKCIYTWFEYASTCPICQTRLIEMNWFLDHRVIVLILKMLIIILVIMLISVLLAEILVPLFPKICWCTKMS